MSATRDPHGRNLSTNATTDRPSVNRTTHTLSPFGPGARWWAPRARWCGAGGPPRPSADWLALRRRQVPHRRTAGTVWPPGIWLCRLRASTADGARWRPTAQGPCDEARPTEMTGRGGGCQLPPAKRVV